MRACAGLLALLVGALGACGRAPKPGAQAEYRAKDGSFSALLPNDWRVDETPGETRKAAVYGPPDGARPYSELMGVYFHAAPDAKAEERSYLASFQDGSSPVSDVSVGGRPGLQVSCVKTVADPHLGLRRLAMRVVVVDAPGGFYSLEHTWPADRKPEPAFDQLVSSFQPGR